jgi:hypothetical protein
MCNGVASKAVDASPGTLTELDGETMDVATFMIANVDMDTYEQQ